MLYQHLKTTRKLGRTLFLLLGVCAVVILLTQQVPMPPVVSSIAHTAATPLWLIRDVVVHRVETSLDTISSKRELTEENVRLQLQIASLRRELHQTELLKRNIRELQTLLGRTDAEQGYIPVSVIVDATQTPHDTFVIDSGASSGIRENMLITTSDGSVLGYVTRVLDNTARAVRFGAANQQVNVVVYASSTLHALLRGQGAGSMQLTLPRDAEVKVGDAIVLPGFSTHLVGTVVHIQLAPEDAFQIVYVESPENIYQTRYVLVDTMHTWQSELSAEYDTPSLHEESTSQ